MIGAIYLTNMKKGFSMKKQLNQFSKKSNNINYVHFYYYFFLMHPRKLKKKLISYIKFKDLAKSIKVVALSQLNNSKKKIASFAVLLSAVLPYFELKYYVMNEYITALLIPRNCLIDIHVK